MITRNEAVGTLYALTGSGLLADHIEESLQDIANCIEAEEDGLHLWGAPDDDLSILYTCPSDDPVNDPLRTKQYKIAEKLAFGPSNYEQEEIEEGGEDEDGDKDRNVHSDGESRSENS